MHQVTIAGCRSPQTLLCLMSDIRAARDAGQRVLVWVPEQYTLQAEWELVEGLNLPGLIDIDVLSPKGLVRMVRERAGGAPLPPLNERGRAMALSMAMLQRREDLHYYHDAVETPGLPDRLNTLVADLRAAGMTPAQLYGCAARAAGNGTRLKEQDVALIWAGMEQLIGGRFLTEEDRAQEAIDRLPLSGLMTGAALFVCGFDVLTQDMLSLMIAAANEADVTVAMCVSGKHDPDARVFLAQADSVRRLWDLLEEAQLPHRYKQLAPMEEGRSPALNHLARQLFADKPAALSTGGAGVRIHMASDPAAEAAYAAAQLRAWHEDGMPWSRMAITLADSSVLPPILSETLTAAGIPHYIARKDSAARHGLCRMLLGALRAACQGYRQDDVLSVARSGFTPLADQEALRLENYALENGIDRRKWLVPFTRGAQAQELEPLRLRLIAPLVTLQNALRTARTASESVQAIWQLLCDMNAYARLLEREEELLRRGMLTELSQNRQMWQTVLDLLDQIHALLGDQRATMRHLARLVEAGLNGAVVAALPPQPDTVMVGEAGHLMTGALDGLLLMGMQDGVTASRRDGLITEAERQELATLADRRIGLSQAEQNALRMSDLYRSISLPAKELVFTCASAGVDGQSLRPSLLLMQVTRVLPDTQVSGGVLADGLPPLSPDLALDGLAVRLRAWVDGASTEPDSAWQAALAALLHNQRWAGRTEAMLAALDARLPALRLTPEIATAAMRQDKVSISRLERFAGCPYQHFVAYALRPVERRSFTFEADERGNFFHQVLQRYTELAAAVPAWPNLPDEDIRAMLEQAIAEARADWQGGPLTEDETGRLLGEEYTRTVRRAAWLFTRHARRTRFSAARAEVSFGAEGTLPPLILELANGRRVALEGIIDRVDDWSDGQSLYRRLIDYKSSDHTIDPVMVRHGLQLQLLLYMLAATSHGEAQPAGMFYFMVKDPLVELDQDIQAEAERLIAEQLRLKGVALADVHVVEAMNGGEDGQVLPSIFKKDGTLRKGSLACDPGQMQALMQNARRIAAELAQRMQEGEIDASPAKSSAGLACERCHYRAICPRDTALPGLRDRDYTAEDAQEAWRLLTNTLPT